VHFSAMAIIIVHGFTVLMNLAASVMMGAGMGLGMLGGSTIGNLDFVQGVWGILFYLFTAGVGCFVIYCANQMRTLKSYGLGLLACILSIVPCYWNCCFLGLPFGIWGLVVLMDQNVKHVFKQQI